MQIEDIMNKDKLKHAIVRTTIILIVLVGLFLVVYLPLKLNGYLDNITSVNSFVDLINSFGALAYLIFWFMEFAQVILGPVPSTIMTTAGAIIFGPLLAYVLCITACLSAAIIDFFLGRWIGRKLIVWIASEESLNKMEIRLKNSKYTFFLMMLFPFFPHDILCYVAGTTKISFKYFLITNIITRSIELIVICSFGSGQIIPYTGWGIPVWILLIILIILSIFFSLKYEDSINKFMENFAKKIAIKFKK